MPDPPAHPSHPVAALDPDNPGNPGDPAGPGGPGGLHDPLSTIVWDSLTTSHAHLAVEGGQARRYPSSIAPFAAVPEPTEAALLDLLALLAPGEAVYLLGDRPPSVPGLQWEGVVPCLQMIFPTQAALPHVTAAQLPILPLDCTHASEMLDLISVAYPGYFRPKTCEMGCYFGIRAHDGTLIAMGGERLVCDPWHEISGLCSHPAHAGKGLGSAILCHLLALHRVQGSRSWLWVVDSNRRAVDLYTRLGFRTLRRSNLHRLRKPALDLQTSHSTTPSVRSQTPA